MSVESKMGLLLGGMVLGALGLFTMAIGLLGLIDPVGSKMSDDADPFGSVTTADYIWSAVIVIVGVVKVSGGGYLIWRIDSKR